MKAKIKTGFVLAIALLTGTSTLSTSARADACRDVMTNNYKMSWKDSSGNKINVLITFFSTGRGYHHNAKFTIGSINYDLDMASDCVPVSDVADFALHSPFANNHLGPIVAEWKFTRKSGTSDYTVEDDFPSSTGESSITPGMSTSTNAPVKRVHRGRGKP